MKKLDKDGLNYLRLLGIRIKELRTKKNISQEDFAADCDFDRTYISLIELGKRNISIVNLKKIADGLNMKLSKLLECLD